MYGQMTAGSWIYIGTQGILQGTYETLAAAARQHGLAPALQGQVRPHRRAGRDGRRAAAGGDHERRRGPLRRGRPLARRAAAATCASSTCVTDNLEEAMTWVEEAVAAGTPKSIGLIGNAAEVLPELLARGVVPDVVTDQTSRPRPALRLHPGRPVAGRSGRAARQRSRRLPTARSMDSMTAPRAGHARLAGSKGRDRLRLRQQPAPAGAATTGWPDAFDYPGFVPAYIRPLFCEGKGPFRWVALSGDPAGHLRHRRGHPRALPGRRAPGALDHAWPRSRSPSRGCRRASAGWATASAPAPG